MKAVRKGLLLLVPLLLQAATLRASGLSPVVVGSNDVWRVQLFYLGCVF